MLVLGISPTGWVVAATRDAEILAVSGPDPELDGLAEQAAAIPLKR